MLWQNVMVVLGALCVGYLMGFMHGRSHEVLGRIGRTCKRISEKYKEQPNA